MNTSTPDGIRAIVGALEMVNRLGVSWHISGCSNPDRAHLNPNKVKVFGRKQGVDSALLPWAWREHDGTLQGIADALQAAVAEVIAGEAAP